MGDDLKYDKQPPTAPPPYTATYPTGNPSPPQYGFTQPGYPQSGYPQSYPQPGYPLQGYPQQQGYPQPPPQTTQPISTAQQTVLIMGGCPSCRVGTLQEGYTCCGICCAIFFFPVGILCCLCMKEKKCTNCGATF